MAMFRDFAEQRNTIASRSTNVTFARSIEIVCDSASSLASSRSISGRYSLVSWPHNRTLKDLSFSRVGVIFNMTYDFLPDQSCKSRTTVLIKDSHGTSVY